MLEAFAITDKGCVRNNNEDYCQIEPELGLYVLADGMGGARAGERASRLAVETVVDKLYFADHRDAQALMEAVEEANRKVLEAAQNDSALEGMGTTLVAVLETGAELAVVSVGDSRAYVFDDNGLRAITRDQTWVNEVGRPLGLSEDSLKTHPMRHVLTMAIGASAALTKNLYSVTMPGNCLLLMCSDGLHGVIDGPAIEAILREAHDGGSLEQSCRKLIEAAKKAGGPDNVTAVLLRRLAG